MHFGLANILFFLAVGFGIPLAILVIGKLVRPQVPEKDKLLVYECGEVPIEQAWFNFNPRFYIVALIFLVFDVEVAFTWPVAAVFKRFVALGQGGLAFVELLAFIAILLLGLAYVWKNGDLEWIRRTRETVLAKAAPAQAEAPAVADPAPNSDAKVA